MNHFNAVDFVILAILFFSVLRGFSRGAAKEIFSLITFAAAIIVASLFASKIAGFFTSNPAVQSVVDSTSTTIGMNASKPISWLALGVSFIGLFIVTNLIGSLISSLISGVIETGLGVINRLLGGVLGFGKGLLINLLLIFLLQLIPQVKTFPLWNQSILVQAYQPTVQWLNDLVAPGLESLKSKVGETIQDMNTKVQGVVNSL